MKIFEDKADLVWSLALPWAADCEVSVTPGRITWRLIRLFWIMTTLRHYFWELLRRLAEIGNWSNGRVGKIFPSNEELGPNGRNDQKIAAVEGLRCWVGVPECTWFNGSQHELMRTSTVLDSLKITDAFLTSCILRQFPVFGAICLSMGTKE